MNHHLTIASSSGESLTFPIIPNVNKSTITTNLTLSELQQILRWYTLRESDSALSHLLAKTAAIPELSEFNKAMSMTIAKTVPYKRYEQAYPNTNKLTHMA